MEIKKVNTFYSDIVLLRRQTSNITNDYEEHTCSLLNVDDWSGTNIIRTNVFMVLILVKRQS